MEGVGVHPNELLGDATLSQALQPRGVGFALQVRSFAGVVALNPYNYLRQELSSPF